MVVWSSRLSCCVLHFLAFCLFFSHSSAQRSLRRRAHVDDGYEGDNASLRSLGSGGTSQPLVFFEVSQPVDVPGSHPCSVLVLQHSFASTSGLPPAMGNFTPPVQCGKDWDSVTLKWSGTSKGRQYDRIAAVWFSGVEVLRTCTAEPTKLGIYWEVKKDITRFSPLLREPQLVVLELGNNVDKTYTGIFNINLTLEFFSRHNLGYVPPGLRCPGRADLVLPISRSSPLPDGYWFQLKNESDFGSKSLRIPTNVYKAILEICVSFHGDDEFWYTNPPNEYLEANNLTDSPGNGPFREVQAFLDGTLVGTVWPFPVIYTGGINPLFWRPAAAIGAYDLPSYDIDVTPFVGRLVDGNVHTFSLRVKNAMGNWIVGANLHLWLDHSSEKTSGNLLSYDAPPRHFISHSNFQGLNGTFHTSAERSISYSGYVQSSMGYTVTHSSYSFGFENVLVFQNNSDVQIVTQNIQTNGEVVCNTGSEVVQSQQLSSSFPLYLYCLQRNAANGSTIQACNLTHAFNQETYMISPSCSLFTSLKNSQQAEGEITVSKDNIVTSGIGALQQRYDFASNKGCYYRILSAKNYTILYDSSGIKCSNTS